MKKASSSAHTLKKKEIPPQEQNTPTFSLRTPIILHVRSKCSRALSTSSHRILHMLTRLSRVLQKLIA